MSYTKQTWATGDTITAAKLNHMEDGIAGAGPFDLVVTCNKLVPDTSTVFTKVSGGTAAELWNKAANGEPFTALFVGMISSGGAATISPFFPTAHIGSTEGVIGFDCEGWPSVYVVYDSNGFYVDE